MAWGSPRASPSWRTWRRWSAPWWGTTPGPRPGPPPPPSPSPPPPCSTRGQTAMVYLALNRLVLRVYWTVPDRYETISRKMYFSISLRPYFEWDILKFEWVLSTEQKKCSHSEPKFNKNILQCWTKHSILRLDDQLSYFSIYDLKLQSYLQFSKYSTHCSYLILPIVIHITQFSQYFASYIPWSNIEHSRTHFFSRTILHLLNLCFIKNRKTATDGFYETIPLWTHLEMEMSATLPF